MPSDRMPDDFKMSYRLVICVDVHADDLKDAYKQVYQAMGKVEAETFGDIQWESSDEWFEPGGDLGDPDKLQAARMAVVDEQRDPCEKDEPMKEKPNAAAKTSK